MNAYWLLTKHCDSRTAVAAIALLILAANAEAADLSLQLEAGAMDMHNPTDDQYVLYHGGPGFSSGVQMTSAVIGIAARVDANNFVFTSGYRDMGHQRIDTDIVDDHIYFGCRYKGTCPPPIERWYTRMSMQEVYASIGYKFQVGSLRIVPTVGIAAERMATTVQVTRPYNWHHGEVTWYCGDHQDQSHPFVGVDVEQGPIGAGVYLLATNNLPTSMGDPGQGERAVYLRVTYRIGGGA